MRLCGENPHIPPEVEEFPIRSYKVPPGLYYLPHHQNDEEISLSGNAPCLTTELRISLL